MMRMRFGTSLPANVPTLLEKEKERNNRVVYRDIIRDCVHSVDIRGSGLISGRIAGARPPQTFYFRMIITLRKFDIRFSNIFSKWDEQEMKSNEARVLKRLKRLFKLIRLSNLNFGPRFSCVSSSLASFLSRNNDSQLNEKGGEKQQTLSLFLSLPPSKRINFDPHPRSKYSRKEIWNRSTKEWLENLSSRAESAPWLTRIETSNQSPLISPISRIAWLPEQECTNGWDATNAKSSFSSLHLSSPSSSLFSRASLRIDRHIYRREPNLLANSTNTRIIELRFQRMPAHNQTANTAGNADPDNSTDDRFWHRSQRGRGNTDTVDILHQPAKLSNENGRRDYPSGGGCSLAFVQHRGSPFFNRMLFWIHLWRSICRFHDIFHTFLINLSNVRTLFLILLGIVASKISWNGEKICILPRRTL